MLRLRQWLSCNAAVAAFDAELTSIARLGSASLREAAESLSNEPNVGHRKKFAEAILLRSLAIQKDMKYWDMISIIQGIAEHGYTSATDSEALDQVSKFLESKLSMFSPKHLIDTIAAFETIGYRSKGLYVEALNRLVQLANTSMYIDEFVALTRMMAIHNLHNQDLLDGICRALLTNDALRNQLRYLHCCEIGGSLARLNFLPKKIEQILMDKCNSEIELMSIDEVWKTATGLTTKLAYSYKPFEDLLVSKLESICASSDFSKILDQVSSPMDFLHYIRARDLLTKENLRNACKWANNAVYRPATRANFARRPTVFEVALLADLCVENGIAVEEVAKAVKITVATDGGTSVRVPKPKPLKYRRRRAYLRKKDPYEERGVVPVISPAGRVLTREMKSNEAAFAPKLRSSVPLWKSRSNAWYFRK